MAIQQEGFYREEAQPSRYDFLVSPRNLGVGERHIWGGTSTGFVSADHKKKKMGSRAQAEDVSHT